MARHSSSRSPVAAAAADEVAAASQALLEAALRGDAAAVDDALQRDGGKHVDVNYVGAVTLRVKCAEVVPREEDAHEVRIGYEEFRTDVTPLFAAAHSGHYEIVRKLLSGGADVNQNHFRGYATTAAARESHCDILGMLLKAGASQLACEDALVETSLCGEAQAAELLVHSDMARLDAAGYALVIASCRGFLNVVKTLVQNGVNINCMSRELLRSVKPALHANVDCTPLVAAIVTRQGLIVKYLLEAGADVDCQVRIGAWSWDPVSGEELRVGACLGEPYNAIWCAVEYFERTGGILRLMLHYKPHLLEIPHLGRTLLCHAILCQNPKAVDVLLDLGAKYNFPISTKNGYVSHPLHLAARVGCALSLKYLISHGCDVNMRTSAGETALMFAAKADNADCFQTLLSSGADLGILSNSGDSAMVLAKRSAFASSVIDIVSRTMHSGEAVCSTDLRVFSPIHFIAVSGKLDLLQMILRSSPETLNKLDGSGLTPLMVALNARQMEAFRLLVMAGADLTAENRDGKTVMSMLQTEAFETVRDSFGQILLAAVLADIVSDQSVFKALHYACRTGDLPSAVQLLKMGFVANVLDDDGYSPLMLAVKEGHAEICKLLLFQGGADCELTNKRGETALSLARIGGRSCKIVEGLLLDHLSRSHVLAGEELLKHTREGRGAPHKKSVRMLKSGVLTWGKSNRRNVICREAAAGASLNFLKNHTKERTDGRKVVFRVVTVTGRHVHFETGSASAMELWVRGINLVVKEAMPGA